LITVWQSYKDDYSGKFLTQVVNERVFSAPLRNKRY